MVVPPNLGDRPIAKTASLAAVKTETPEKAPTKLSIVEQRLRAPGGASIAELVAATGWQQHSVRGVMAGTLRKRGLVISSSKIDGVRRYSIDGQ